MPRLPCCHERGAASCRDAGRHGGGASAAARTAGARAARAELTVIVPTRNERDNIIPLYQSLDTALAGCNWEMMVVDDDSANGTAAVVRFLAQHDRRVRLLHRVGRRRLASAFVEGAQASTASYVAVIDADLQHDETLPPQMLKALENEDERVDVAAGGVGLVTRMAVL